MCCVPLPWCTSQSRMSTRCAPQPCAALAATAALLKKQKPMAMLLSAWWPGGRTMAAPCAASPWTTLQATSAAPPAANRAQWKVCALAYMSLVMRSSKGGMSPGPRSTASARTKLMSSPECTACRASREASGHSTRVQRSARLDARMRDMTARTRSGRSGCGNSLPSSCSSMRSSHTSAMRFSCWRSSAAIAAAAALFATASGSLMSSSTSSSCAALPAQKMLLSSDLL
mmetsp:Transcript_4558/g.12455  ORF Transcript_4558/g.12455 Transcript_4558/m.12455 type:complete len:229 (-) Transcript_4558:594-1280(-)